MRTAALLGTVLVLATGSVRGQGYGSPTIPPPPPDLLPAPVAYPFSAPPVQPPLPGSIQQTSATSSAPTSDVPGPPANLLPPPAPFTPPPAPAQTPNPATPGAGDSLPNPAVLPAPGTVAAPPGTQAAPPAACDPTAAPSGFLETLGPAGLPYKAVWGVTDLKLFPDSRRVAPNGVAYHPISSLDLDFNLWLWPSQRLYAFGITRFWVMQDDDQPLIQGPKSTGKSSALGVGNWAKREFDLTVGGAWNYYGFLEARVFAYSLSNLNRGNSLVSPYGFNDGLGVENRYYLSQEYARLGQAGFDISRATFLSIGYDPTKVLMGLDGQFFAPGLFLRAYLTYDLPSYRSYLFSDIEFLSNKTLNPKQLLFDGGLAITPCKTYRMFEVRIGTEIVGDYQDNIVRSNWLPYISARLNF